MDHGATGSHSTTHAAAGSGDPPGTVVTVGNFDGVHRGHQALVRRAAAIREELGAGARVLAVCFEPHPLSVLRPGAEPPRLAGYDLRRRWLLESGADRVIALEPTRELLDLSPEAFIDMLISRHGMKAMVEGHDFRFGRGRAGGLDTLEGIARSRGFRLEAVTDPVTVDLNDQSMPPASSTLARWLIERGRVDDAARVFGRSFTIGGEVVRGDRLGRTIGVPTANVRTGQLLPADGVYAGVGVLPDGDRLVAAINVGTRPTVDGTERRLEAHLVTGADPGTPWAPLPGVPEYGWPIELEIHRFVRDQVRFSGLAALRAQLGRDIARAVTLVGDPARGARNPRTPDRPREGTAITSSP